MLRKEQVDLNQFPEKINYPDAKHLVALGDLHASLLKLLWFLKHEGIYEIYDVDYHRINTLLHLPADSITQKEHNELVCLLNVNPIATNDNIYAILLGDDTFDRNGNDGDYIAFLKAIFNLRFSIICSNHGLDFILAREKIIKGEEKFFTHSVVGADIDPNNIASGINLNKLIERDLIKINDIVADIKAYYFPKLRLIEYNFTEDGGLVTYKHSTAGLSYIRRLSQAMSVEYRDETAQALAETYERMNSIFLNEYLNKDRVHELCIDKNGDYNGPLVKYVWERTYDLEDLPAVHPNGYRMYYVNGHHTNKKLKTAHITQLNNVLAMHFNFYNHEYTVHQAPYIETPDISHVSNICERMAKTLALSTLVDHKRFAAYLDTLSQVLQVSIASIILKLGESNRLPGNIYIFLIDENIEEANNQLTAKLNLLLNLSAKYDVANIEIILDLVIYKDFSIRLAQKIFMHKSIDNFEDSVSFLEQIEKFSQISLDMKMIDIFSDDEKNDAIQYICSHLKYAKQLAYLFPIINNAFSKDYYNSFQETIMFLNLLMEQAKLDKSEVVYIDYIYDILAKLNDANLVASTILLLKNAKEKNMQVIQPYKFNECFNTIRMSLAKRKYEMKHNLGTYAHKDKKTRLTLFDEVIVQHALLDELQKTDKNAIKKSL